jgi:WD40 repeat protein
VASHNPESHFTSDIAWSPDGSKAATSSRDGTAKVWDGNAGREILTVLERDRSNSVWSVAWSPDGSKLATAGSDANAKVWDAASGRQLLALPQIFTTSVAWLPDGTKLATGSADNTARIWEDSKRNKRCGWYTANG